MVIFSLASFMLLGRIVLFGWYTTSSIIATRNLKLIIEKLGTLKIWRKPYRTNTLETRFGIFVCWAGSPLGTVPWSNLVPSQGKRQHEPGETFSGRFCLRVQQQVCMSVAGLCASWLLRYVVETPHCWSNGIWIGWTPWGESCRQAVLC
jgi:hypothetical protein